MSTTSNINFTTKKSVQRWKDICEMIAKTPMTAPDISRALDYPPERVNAFIRHHRLSVHIDCWRKTGFVWTPVWAFGSGKDAERPAPKVDVSKDTRREFVSRPRSFKPQPVARDWSVAMMFGPGVNLNAELRGMRA